MSKIPFSAKEETIRNFFKNYSIAENGIRLLVNRKGNSLEKAIITFTSVNECKKALEEKNGNAFPLTNQ
jgi:RNA recognition motif-containing protein